MQWNLVRMRKESGLTQKQMAEMLNIGVTTYIRKESGKNDFLLNEMFFISSYFEKPIEDIFLPSNCISDATG